ncbi:unnamed protein product [Vitrella brassicaformis CCMP3155]|uniref:Aminotransferase class V domain-containing protein n=1 Tax=Vitrella brassicaformis (strain CCMP3155) TaxID=1169540 RepID=A0A0G4EL27_VITBC|nr:unnamed protein product [Vitrella brassicaformis CCMP3155]|eukprot:CEL98111.1 unnamed protein product [Vitrella brassicaformis CCMP3155]
MTSPHARRDFGSFHSSNVEELLAVPVSEWRRLLPFPDPAEAFFISGAAHQCDASTLKATHFFLEEEFTFINHGAFGAVLRPVMAQATAWREHMEGQPVRFVDRRFFLHYVDVVRQMATFVDCDPRGLVLVPNATTAINTVVRGLVDRGLRRVIHLNVTYGATMKLLRSLESVEMHQIDVTMPIVSREELMAGLERQVKDLYDSVTEGGTTLFLIDAIPSNLPVVLPLKDLISMAKTVCGEGLLTLVDGAHLLLQTDLRINTIGADFVACNCHKWLCGAKGSAFLYVAEPHRQHMRPLVASHGYLSGFSSAFAWTGLQDVGAYLSLDAALAFWRRMGPPAVRVRLHGLLDEATSLLTSSWRTSLPVPIDLLATMALVELPRIDTATLRRHVSSYGVNRDAFDSCADDVRVGELPEGDGMGRVYEYADAESVQNYLYWAEGIEVPAKSLQGCLYVRISVHVYNCLDDYRRLADAVAKLYWRCEALRRKDGDP